MKRLIIITTFAFLFSTTFVLAQDKVAEKRFSQPPCPKTTMVDNCFECHVKGSFKVKETAPDCHLDYPNRFTRIRGWEDKNLYGYYTLNSIDADEFQSALEFYKRHGIKNIVVELFSPGGSMFQGIKITSLMDEWIKNGGIIETRVYGVAASAAFMIFVNGTPGRRLISPQCHIMWHELVSFKMFDVSSPSDKEDEARILRHFQNTANEWLASKSKLKKDEIDALIRKKEYWLNGKQAVNFGFADKFI